MHAESASRFDWRDGAAYAPLLGADRSFFAWEWLRRDPDYRAASLAALTGHGSRSVSAKSFGLVAFEPFDVEVPYARPVWRRDFHPIVLAIRARFTAGAADMFDIDALHPLARTIVGRDTEHLLLSDGLRAIRLDGPRGAFSSGPVCLRYSIEGLTAAEAPLLALRRFLALCRTGDFSRALHRREIRARRWIMMLRAHDAIIAGADQRQIAQQLFSSSTLEPRWRVREPSVRSQVQRLIRSARQISARGYRSLL